MKRVTAVAYGTLTELLSDHRGLRGFVICGYGCSPSRPVGNLNFDPATRSICQMFQSVTIASPSPKVFDAHDVAEFVPVPVVSSICCV